MGVPKRELSSTLLRHIFVQNLLELSVITVLSVPGCALLTTFCSHDNRSVRVFSRIPARREKEGREKGRGSFLNL